MLKVIAIAFLLVSGLQGTISDFLTVFSLYVLNPRQVGEIAPFSSNVCREITKHIAHNKTLSEGEPRCYLEAGGGCGGVPAPSRNAGRG